jgi:hypothetical protein
MLKNPERIEGDSIHKKASVFCANLDIGLFANTRERPISTTDDKAVTKSSMQNPLEHRTE